MKMILFGIVNDVVEVYITTFHTFPTSDIQ